MFKISPGSPAYYLTSVTKVRLPVFRIDKIKTVVSNALNEARESGGFLIFAYVIMPDHLHLVTDSSKKPEEILRYVNGIVARRVINFLKENGYTSSLEKLRHEDYRRGHRYSLWDHPSEYSPVDEREHVHATCALHTSESGQSGFGKES